MDINRAINFFRDVCVCNDCIHYGQCWDCDSDGQYSFYECCADNCDDDSCECHKRKIALEEILNYINQLENK